MLTTRIIAIAVMVGCALSLATFGHAQSVMELDAIVVEGRVQRPQASYIIQRSSLDFGIQAKRRSFVDKIVKSLEGDPF